MLNSIDADKLNRADATHQKVQTGTAIRSAIIQIDFAVTADATSSLTIPVPYDIDIRDIIVQATATSGSGTLTLRTGTDAISDAIVCAADKTIARAGTLDDAYTTILKGANLNVIANGATDRGIITIIGVPV